ncbi:hypothetical protein GCM10027085_40840 [Spirosoma aerophilum]
MLQYDIPSNGPNDAADANRRKDGYSYECMVASIKWAEQETRSELTTKHNQVQY